MSLTAHLLFGKPTRLPKGRLHAHRPDGHWKAPCNTQTKLANIERVYNAVADGVDNIIDITESTGISETTVKKALFELEDWPEGPRIIRIKEQRHRFKVAAPAASEAKTEDK